MANGPSIGKELFDQITGQTDPVAFLTGMVNSTPPTVENEYRDFKGATDPRTGVEIDPKKTWSEALAGFATTSGGVLIWGIDARKNPSGIDEAGALNLVPSPHAWKTRLQELHLQATDPPVPGVLIEAYPDPASGGKGFVACYIPESDYKPHRAEAANRRWLMRIGCNFVDVPPPVLRSLFFPQRRSYIFMRVAVVTETNDVPGRPGIMPATFSVRLYNEGPATATSLTVLGKRIEGMTYALKPQWLKYATATGEQFIYESAFHPGAMVEVVDASIDLPFAPRIAREMGRNGDVEFAFQLYATDQAPQQIRFHCSADLIIQQSTWTGLPEPLPMGRFR